MKIEKYHGLGNTFLITTYQEGMDYSKLAKRLCNNNISIGADGLIIVKHSPLEMLIFNKDGSEALMCGNGLRCFVHYCFNNELLSSKINNIEVRTRNGNYFVDILSLNPFVVKTSFNRGLIRKKQIEILGKVYDTYYVRVGVKHNVIVNDLYNQQIVDYLQEQLIKDKRFCVETNIDIVRIINKENITVKTYERGVGFTSSCGTGSIASALVCNYLYSCSNHINIKGEYGDLKAEVVGNKVYMIGPSNKICNIEVDYA